MAIALTDHEVVGKEFLPKGKRDYTKLIHLEKAEPLIRRIHRIEIQDVNGEVEVLEGSFLPLTIVTSTVTGQSGRHLMQILLNPKPRRGVRVPSLPTTWPTWGGVIHFLAGVLVAHLLWSVRYGVEMAQCLNSH